MIHLRRDRYGLLARLECDECHREGILFLIGHARMSRPRELAGMRRWLREHSRGTGWIQLPTVVEDQPVEIDLCRKCGGKVLKSL